MATDFRKKPGLPVVILVTVVLVTAYLGIWPDSTRQNLLSISVAHGLLSRDAARVEMASDDLSRLKSERPNDERIVAWWARAQVIRNNPASLISVLESRRLTNSGRGRAMLVAVGNFFLNQRDFEHFRMAWQQAGVWSRLSANRYQLLVVGREAIEEEQWGFALGLFRSLAKACPDDAQSHRYLAQVLEQGYGDSSGAIAEREQVVALEPDSFWDRMALSGLYAETGRLDKAERQYERAVALDPDHERAINGLAGILLKEGKAAEAAVLYASFMEKHPDNEFIVVRLAGVYRDLGQDSEAVHLLETFVNRNPDSVPARVTLGWLYDELGRRDKAYAMIEPALQEGSDPYYLAWGHKILAEIASSRGDAEQAAWHTEQAKALSETFSIK